MKPFFNKFSSIIILFCFIFSMSACGAANSEISEKEDEETKENTAETKLYDGVDGEIEIPREPKRIVVVSRAYLGHLLALDIKPIGAPSDALDNPFLEGMVDGIEDIGAGTISVEQILELEPDLIITASIDEKEYEQFKKVAPTVQIPWGVYDFRETLKEMGEITGKEQQAVDWLNDYDQYAEESKKKLNDALGADETIAIMEIYEKSFFVYGNNYGRGGEVLYQSLGLKAPERVQKDVIDGEGWLSISLETLPEYGADHIVLSVLDNAAENANSIMESGIWKNMTAVKNGNVYEIDAKSFYNSDPISLKKEMEILVDLIVAKYQHGEPEGQ